MNARESTLADIDQAIDLLSECRQQSELSNIMTVSLDGLMRLLLNIKRDLERGSSTSD